MRLLVLLRLLLYDRLRLLLLLSFDNLDLISLLAFLLLLQLEDLASFLVSEFLTCSGRSGSVFASQRRQ